MTENHPTAALIFKHLAKGSRKKDHPFRFFTLASFDRSFPGLRTVVLRDTSEEEWIEFYTDVRSPKVAQFRQTPEVTALFYNPKKRWQITLKGQVQQLEEADLIEKRWESLPDYARSDYSSNLPPGSVLHSESSLEWKADGRSNFAVFRIHIQGMESLQLLKTAHQRFRYSRREESWKLERLTP